MDPDSFAPNTVQPTSRKPRAGGRSAVKRIPDGKVLRRDNQWVSHGSVHYSYRMDLIARRLVVTFWRATMIGLRKTCLNPDDHMMDMWQKDYVLQVDNWKKQWSGCSKTLMITAQSSNSIGLRLRRLLLGLRNGRGSRRRQFLGFQGSRTGSNIGRCLKPLYV